MNFQTLLAEIRPVKQSALCLFTAMSWNPQQANLMKLVVRQTQKNSFKWPTKKYSSNFTCFRSRQRDCWIKVARVPHLPRRKNLRSIFWKMVAILFTCVWTDSINLKIIYRYFEFEVLTAGPMRVGWAKADAKPGYQLGQDDCSWAFDGWRVCKIVKLRLQLLTKSTSSFRKLHLEAS